jgi:hypothetical protein
MAQSSPGKIPKGKTNEYAVILLSDKSRIGSLLSGLSIATCNPSLETDIASVDGPQDVEGKRIYEKRFLVVLFICSLIIYMLLLA